MEDIKKDFSKLRYIIRHRFFKSKINEFIRSLYNIQIQKNLHVKETPNIKRD